MLNVNLNLEARHAIGNNNARVQDWCTCVQTGWPFFFFFFFKMTMINDTSIKFRI